MKHIICSLFICTTFLSVSAQDVYNSSGKAGGYKKKEQKGYDPAKLVIGGGLNFGYSGDVLSAGLSPKVGYKLTNFFAAGVGLGYQYFRAPQYYQYGAAKTLYYKDNMVTPGIWAKCTVYNPIFLAADIEYNMIYRSETEPDYTQNGSPLVKVKANFSVPCMLVGAGMKQTLGGRTCGTFEIMYDVIQDENSPYLKQLVYRASIFVGL